MSFYPSGLASAAISARELSRSSLRIRLRLIAFLIAALGLAAASSAQSYQIFADEYQRILTETRWKLGPFRIYPALAIRDVGFDDNLYFGTDEGKPVKDFTATVSPEVRIYWPLRTRLLLYVRENPEYAYFRKESYQRSFTNSYGAGFRYLLLGRFVLSADAGNDKHRRRISSEFQIPANDRVRSIAAGLSYETARKTSIGITAAVRKISYEEVMILPEAVPVERLLDREDREIAAEAYYQLFSDGYLFFRGGFQEYRFVDETAVWRNASATDIRAGLRFPLLGRIRGVLNLGYKLFDPKTAGEPKYAGLVGNTGLDLRTGRFAVRLQFVRDLVFSTYSEVFYYVEDSVRLGGSVYLTPFLKIDYDFSRGRADYSTRPMPSGGEGAEASGEREDRHRLHSLGLIFRIFKTAGVGLSWNAERWTSGFSNFDRTRNFVGLVLNKTF